MIFDNRIGKSARGSAIDARLVKKQGILGSRRTGGKGRTMDLSKLDFSKMSKAELDETMQAIKAQQKTANEAKKRNKEAQIQKDADQEKRVKKVIVQVRKLLKDAGVCGNVRIWMSDDLEEPYDLGTKDRPAKITRQKDHLLSQGDYDHLLANYKDPKPEKIDGNLFLIAGKKFSAKKLVQFTILKSETESQTEIMGACPCLSDGQVKGAVTAWRHSGEREKVKDRVTVKKTKKTK